MSEISLTPTMESTTMISTPVPMNANTLLQTSNTSYETNVEKCVICLEVKNNGKELYTDPDCKHTFHSSCIVTWYRYRNFCPYCRNLPDPSNMILEDIQSKCRFACRFAKRIDAPKDLKNLVSRFEKIKKRTRDRKKEYTTWLNSEEGIEFKRLQKIQKRLENRIYPRRKGWGNQDSYHKLQAEIANYPVVPIFYYQPQDQT